MVEMTLIGLACLCILADGISESIYSNKLCHNVFEGCGSLGKRFGDFGEGG